MTRPTQPSGNADSGKEKSAASWSPYAAGFGLGVTLLLSYWFLGAGLGASGAFARLTAWIWHAVAPGHVAASAYFGEWFGPEVPHVLGHYLVFMAMGIFVGGGISALGSRRIRPMMERGPDISVISRLLLALGGGVLVGFAARLARGCTSGQGLSGGAMLLTGSMVFLGCMFIGAYAAAVFVRREWL
ncbi:MAG: YeeE/YedE family protein [Deltaproteobacteria bacterium]|nr:YeeE/YedE family protein [Deltaproteobacteria bacterium]